METIEKDTYADVLMEISKGNEALIPSYLNVEYDKHNDISELKEINHSIFKNGSHFRFFQLMRMYYQKSFETNSKYKYMQGFAEKDLHKIEIYQKCIERVIQRHEKESIKFLKKLKELTEYKNNVQVLNF